MTAGGHGGSVAPVPETTARSVFGESEVGRALAAVDWGATPLGPPATWSAGLRTTVRVMLSSRFAMWMAWGPELTFLCNDSYRRDTLGGKFPWALGRPSDQVWSEVWTAAGPRIQHVMTTGEATWDEGLQLFLERDGYREETYHTFSYSPLSDDDGTVVGMLCVVSEDTAGVVGARRMALVRDLGAHLTALRTQGEVLDTAARELGRSQDLLPFALVYLLDEAGAAVLSASTGLALPHEAAPPVVPPDDVAVWPVEQVLTGRSVVVADLDRRFADLPTGGWDDPPREALVVPFRQQDSERPSGFLVAALTPYRQLDDEHQGFVELVGGQVGAALATARAYEDERRRAERLLELDRAKTDFFTNVSHEFRTPLTLMLGPTEDALADPDEPLPPGQRHRVEVVRRNGERLLKLVDTLLDFSRLESGQVQARFEPVDLAAATAELAETFRPAVERVGLELLVRCDPLPGPVWVDREMWAKVVLNLLSNAFKFTFEGSVAVVLEATEDGARLQVADTGTGIGPDQQARLFERFARVAGARSRSFEGSGIGLALVHDLAGVHGGRVEVSSELGRGSTFTVTVPWGRQHLPEGEVVEAAGPDGTEPGAASERSARGFLAEATRWLVDADPVPADEPAGPGERPRVLVVDDNADMREHVAGLLRPEHDVLLAADGLVGLELALTESPDLILSDVMMPGLDGVGLLEALRADVRTAHVPVVLISARAGEEATVRGPGGGRRRLPREAVLEPGAAGPGAGEPRAGPRPPDAPRARGHAGPARPGPAPGAGGQLGGRRGHRRHHRLDGVRPPGRPHRRGGRPSAASTRPSPTASTPTTCPWSRPPSSGPSSTPSRSTTSCGCWTGTAARAPTGPSARSSWTSGARPSGCGAATRTSPTSSPPRRRAPLPWPPPRWPRASTASPTSSSARCCPRTTWLAEELTVASFYSAGAEGTQVGGDWYDVIELGGGRTALVVGDVMGRGVRAAAVMGQLRSAVRAFARLDLPPSQVLEYLDGVVRDLGEDQIVTCLYAVYDPYDARLTVANAGHLPPLVRRSGGPVERLRHAQGPPLGTVVAAVAEVHVTLEADALLVLYTDGLVEDRGRDIDDGIDALSALVGGLPEHVGAGTPADLVRTLLPGGSDDDIAVLMAQVHGGQPAPTLALTVRDEPSGIPSARHEVGRALRSWGVGEDTVDTVALLLSELVTNALVHGRPPVHVRVRRGPTALSLEVHDNAQTLPRRGDPSDSDEHGRGLQLVSAIAARWGTRPTIVGKAVWCSVPLD